jgi:hypothetical protein
MGMVARNELPACDGFRVESPNGPVGWVEEVWLGRPNEPSAFALRLFDGRHGLLTDADVVAVLPEDALVVTGPDPAMLELGPPRVERWSTANGHVDLTATWSTTGAVIELPRRSPSRLRAAVLARRPWLLRPTRREGEERPLWQTLILLYAGLAFLVLLVISLAFVIARLLTGTAY